MWQYPLCVVSIAGSFHHAMRTETNPTSNVGSGAEAKASAPKSFRQLLQQEFIRRCQTNPRYSMRGFARVLGVDPSTLSQVLRGKRPLTAAQVKKLGARLGMSPGELGTYLQEVGKRRRLTAADERDMSEDVFSVIADWYHFAIFELVNTRGFKPDARWIARRLSISMTEAQIAMERLISLEIVLVQEDGSWKQGTPMLSTTNNPFTAAAYRKFQAQILRKSLAALEEMSFDFRDHTGMTLAMRHDQVPAARAMIKEFRRKFCESMQGGQPGGDFDSVYQLGIGLFPLTRIEEPDQDHEGV